jgi:hypothetical protein
MMRPSEGLNRLFERHCFFLLTTAYGLSHAFHDTTSEKTRATVFVE